MFCSLLFLQPILFLLLDIEQIVEAISQLRDSRWKLAWAVWTPAWMAWTPAWATMTTRVEALQTAAWTLGESICPVQRRYRSPCSQHLLSVSDRIPHSPIFCQRELTLKIVSSGAPVHISSAPMFSGKRELCTGTQNKFEFSGRRRGIYSLLI